MGQAEPHGERPSTRLHDVVVSHSGQFRSGSLCRRSMTRAALCTQVCPAGPDGQRVGLEIKDCGECTFCLDKPRFGGKGTKRQKCINKKIPSQGPVQTWAALSITSKCQQALIEQYASQEVRTRTSLVDTTLLLLRQCDSSSSPKVHVVPPVAHSPQWSSRRLQPLVRYLWCGASRVHVAHGHCQRHLS